MSEYSRTDHTLTTELRPPALIALRGAALWAIAVASLGACVLPALAISGAPVRAAPWQCGIAGLIAVVTALVASRITVARYLVPLGVAIAGVAAWLLAQSSYPAGAWVTSPTLGIGIVLAVGPALRTREMIPAVIPSLAWAAALVGVRVLFGRDAVMAAGAFGVAISAGAAWVTAPVRPIRRGRMTAFTIVAPIIALTTAGYIGATTPSATWFGSLVHNGPRDSNEVALTFDDGPNPPYSMEIARILDGYGTKGTFFTVGKALEARPDVSKALLDDGQLLGNHSYNHDAFSWLDPRYPELQQTQDAFQRNLGVCPAFYRPPHGSHTPFMARVIGERDMTMVTWDVSAADWATDDPDLVARRVLEKVKPGSIILLHDGIDGNIGADWSVVVEALPMILDGLRDRGLKPVRLDELLGGPGYLEKC